MSDALSRIMAGAAAKKHKKAASGRGEKRPTGGKSLFTRLQSLYADMETAYNACARQAGLSCADCPTNCCTSFFQHHTYVEWAYLWRGLHELAPGRREELAERARRYVADAQAAIAAGVLPDAMCPLNEDGLCVLYPYRLMICRMHGTGNVFTLPDGRVQEFPGCARFTALPGAQQAGLLPVLDRTPFYRELASLETELLQKAGRPLPRVDITLAEMIVLGPPKIR